MQDITVNRARLIQTFVALASIPSPLMKVGEIMVFLRRLIQAEFDFELDFDAAGSNLENYECGNMVFTIPATPNYEYFPPLAVEAHVDTVAVPTDAPINIIIEDDIIRTDGTTILGADDKSGIAAILEALWLIQENKIPHVKIIVIFSVGEESSMYGVHELDYALLEGVKSIVSVDGLGNALWRSCAAKLKWKIIVNGKEGHGAFPEKALNAIIITTRIINEMLQQGLLGNKNDFGIIRGDNYEDSVWHNLAEFNTEEALSAFPATNVVPPQAVLSGELRAFSKKRLEDTFKQIQRIVQETASNFSSADGNHQASVEFETEYPYEPFCLRKNDPLIQRVTDAMKKAGIENPEAGIIAGATHANVFNMHSIASIVLGAGGHNPHTNDEKLNISEMTRAAETLVHYLTAK